MSVHQSGLNDPALVGEVDLARAAAQEVAGDERVGAYVEYQIEDSAAVTHHFEADKPSYQGWRWAVTITSAGPDTDVTVSEVVLLPGPTALVAPEWIPWQDRVQAGDLGVGDLLPTAPDDPRLVPAYLQSDDPAVEEVAAETGLGRVRVMSRPARLDAADRWSQSEFGPRSDMARSAPAHCGTCGFYLPLAGSLRAAFGTCGNELSPADGHVVHAEYGCGAHSEAEVEQVSPVLVADLIYDDAQLDVEPLAVVDEVPEEAPDASDTVEVSAEPQVAVADSAVGDAAPEVAAEPQVTDAAVAPSDVPAEAVSEAPEADSAEPPESISAASVQEREGAVVEPEAGPVSAVATPEPESSAVMSEAGSVESGLVAAAESEGAVVGPVVPEVGPAESEASPESEPESEDAVVGPLMPEVGSAESAASSEVESESAAVPEAGSAESGLVAAPESEGAVVEPVVPEVGPSEAESSAALPEADSAESGLVAAPESEGAVVEPVAPEVGPAESAGSSEAESESVPEAESAEPGAAAAPEPEGAVVEPVAPEAGPAESAASEAEPESEPSAPTPEADSGESVSEADSAETRTSEAPPAPAPESAAPAGIEPVVSDETSGNNDESAPRE